MAKDVYCDQSGGSDSNGGTSWADAYLLLGFALDGAKVLAGDTLWVKNSKSTTGQQTLTGAIAFTNDPPKVIGCKPATSATPPANSDVIPGIRTGQSTFAYDDAGVPTLTLTGSGNDLKFGSHFSLIYGLKFVIKDNIESLFAKTSLVFEECYLSAGNGETGTFNFGNVDSNAVRSLNCKWTAANSGLINNTNSPGLNIFERCIFDTPNNPTLFQDTRTVLFDSCDFSARTNALVGQAGGKKEQGHLSFLNCKINASSALVTGSLDGKFRTEFIHTTSVSGKTTGQTFQEIDIITNNGNITEELTRFRTGGADDGGSGEWSLAFTPGDDGTFESYSGLTGPRMAIEVVGDGTAQTLTVYIANSSASTDYKDDEVWLVAKSPSETGTADYDFYTTQMDLLATPATVTTDGSTWGSGANNPQKLTISLSPDYDGIIECWVVFAKNFASSPETLYVDPLPVLS